MYYDFGTYGFDFLTSIKNPPIRLISVGVQKVDSKNYRFDNRNREDCYLFQYTLSGSGTVSCADGIYTVGEGSGFFIHMPSDSEYYFDESKDEEWHFLYVRLDGYACEPYFNLIEENVGSIFSLDSNSKCIKSLLEIHRRASLGLISDSFTGERLVFDFLCKLCSCLFNNEDGFSDIVRKAKQIIDTEYSNLSGVFDISERLGVSQNHLCRVFSYETKTTPIEYLTRVRLKEAVNLLNDGNDTVEDIAIKCGFSCGNYFCKVFKKNMGMSPLEYRGKTKLTNYDSIVI